MPADFGDARVRIIRPVGATGVLPVIIYMHGGGWILGGHRAGYAAAQWVAGT